MAVHKTKPSGVPKVPVRRIGGPGSAPSKERVAELVRSGFFAPSVAPPFLGDPERDRLPNKKTS